ncbi:MAG: B12-binding domain-containing radical SAM protein [Terriglobia bacterium]|nr:MAG: B12-binding domain-containing radical SAM protein [Terriglobia bacterium]
MDLLLTHGYFLQEDPKELQIMKPYAPLGILYLSSYLRARGFGVEIYDSTFGSREALFRILETEPPSTLGLYVNLMTRANALAILERAVACGWRVIVGGPEPSNYADRYLEAGAHAVVAGEGELALEAILRGSPRSAIPGVYFSGGEAGPPRLIPDLDAQPWPDRERIDIGMYLRAWRERHGTGSVSLITARGCPYHCRWCSHSTFGKTHRRRSPVAVVNELEWILGRYSPDMLWLADDVFTIHHGWLDQYTAEMKRRALRVPFECITRADRVNARVAAQLAELGCFRVWIGSESGSQRILDRMERGVTVAQVREAVGQLRQHGIQTGMFFMWGYEGEELEDIEATYAHLKACRPDLFFTTVSYPIKGTPYYDEVAPKLVQVGPWEATTDRESKIQGRHSRRFYQFADQLLRSETAAEAEKAREGLKAAWSEVEAFVRN